MRIAVIGSGIGGLATACILAKAGHRVVVYEKNEVHGGRAAVLKDQGFTFDMGPSWYLMPDVFERFFAAIGEDIHKHLNLIKLDPAYRIYFEEDTTPTDIHSSVEKTAALFEKIEPGAGTVFAEYVQRTKAQYELAVGHFLYRDYRSVFHVFNTKVFSALSIIPWYGTIDGYVRRFFQSAKIRKVLEYTTVFLGVSPSTAPALYAMMAYVDFGLGVYYSQGGIGKLIEAFVTIAKKHGVEFHLNKPVTSIETEHGVATAIRFADGTRDTFDVVISNADMHHTETALLKTEDQSYPASYWEKTTLAPSGLLMYLGVRGSLPQLKHHTLYFSENWDEHFDSIYKHPSWPKNPSLYISNTSKTDPSVAPAGHENVFVFVPIASRFGKPEEVPRFADFILKHIAAKLDIPDFEERIVYKKIFGPHDFAARYNSYGNSALGLGHTLGQTAIFRPKNKSKKISNLYYVGAGVHPGIGMPVCLISAQLVAERIQQEYHHEITSGI